jgi:ABC-type nitrate/sulfonate/bicarbonate transport system substrate-binding protein
MYRRNVFTGLVAAALLGTTNAQAQTKVDDVAIAVSSTSFVLGGVRIAENAGIFEKNGLHPRIIVMDSGNSAMSALIGGSVQFVVAGPSEALAARARGQNIVIVANLYRGLAGSVVLSKKAAGEAKVKSDASMAEKLKALDGLTIAVPSATSALLAPVRVAAEAAGAKIHFTYMSQPAMVSALESNAIQGMIASYPFAGTPVLRGTGILWINGPRGELPEDALPTSSSALETTTDYAKSNAEMIRRLRQVLEATGAFIAKSPDEAKAALAKGYPTLSPKDIDLAFSEQKANWAQPVFSTADIKHEIVLLQGSATVPGLATLDPASMLSKNP